MKTIRIYGDSFASAERPDCWPHLLATKLSLPIVNKAVAGSCTEYAIKSFIEDVENNIVEDDDIIIYIPSQASRLNLSFQLNAAPGSAICADHDGHGKYEAWKQENQKHIDWWIMNHDTRMQTIQFESYIQLLKNFASNQPKCIVIVLPAYPISVREHIWSKVNRYNYPTKIFNSQTPSNFLRANICLYDVSIDEIKDTHLFLNLNENFAYKKFIKFTILDPRSNHLTNPNLHILSNLLIESIQTLNIDNITLNKFETKNLGFITNKKEYLKYVSNNILPWLEGLEKLLK